MNGRTRLNNSIDAWPYLDMLLAMLLSSAVGSWLQLALKS